MRSPSRPPLSPPERTQTIRNVQLDQGTLPLDLSFKRWRGWGQAAGNWGPVSLGRLAEQTPRRPSLQLQQPRGKQRPARSRRSLGVCRTAVPLSQLRRRGRRSPAATAHLLPQLHVPPSCAARGRHRPLAPRPSPEAPRTPPSLTYGGVVREGALVLVHPVPRPGHADRGHVRHQQLADVSCSHLPAAAAARHAEQGAPALHGRGVRPSGAEPGRAGALGLPAAAAAAAGCAGDGSRAGAGGQRGPRGGNGHRGPGAGGRGCGGRCYF